MPKINYKNNTITWDWEDWLAGLHPQYGVSAQRFDGASDQLAFNPFRFLGYASPGELNSDCTNSNQLAGLIVAMDVSASNQRGYAVGGAKIFEINPSGTPSIVTTSPYPITVSKAVMNDIVRYNKASDGTEYMFYSYKGDGTAGDKSDIGRLTTNDGTNDTSYWITTMSGTTLTDDIDHPMIVGDDDVLYIGDKNIVRGLDGADSGTMISVALTLPAQYTIRSFSKLDNNTLVIFANYGDASNGTMGIFFWNYLDLDPYKSVYIQGYCCSSFNYRGTIAMIRSSLSPDLGSNVRSLNAMAWDGEKFVSLNRFSIRTSSYVLNKGVEVINDAIYFSVGGINYCYGSPFSEVKAGLNKISSTTGSASGAVKTLTSGIQFVSSSTSTTNYYLQYYSGDYAISYFKGNNVDLEFPLRKKGRIKRLRAEFKSAVSTAGRELNITIYSVDGTVLIETFTGTELRTISTDTLTIEKEYDASDDTSAGIFDTLYPLLQWSTGAGSTYAPILKKLIVEYELINI